MKITKTAFLVQKVLLTKFFASCNNVYLMFIVSGIYHLLGFYLMQSEPGCNNRPAKRYKCSNRI